MKFLCFAIAVLKSAFLFCPVQGLSITYNITDPASVRLPLLTHCNASLDWLPENTRIDQIYPDCLRATLSFYQLASRNGEESFEFRSYQTSNTTDLRSIFTPSKYTYGVDYESARL